MISAPLVADIGSPAVAGGHGRPKGLSARSIALIGIALVACGIIGLAAWGIFLSPLGFTRYALSERDRTFTIRHAGTYVVYFEFPGESRSLLPPALDIGVASLSGQEVDVTIISAPGHRGAPGGYDVWGREGRAVALITSHEAGTFVVSITPTPATEVDTDTQRIVTQGTIALGREWSATWLASWGGVTLLVVVPLVAGVAVLVLAWRRRGPRPGEVDPGPPAGDGHPLDAEVPVGVGVAPGAERPFEPPTAPGLDPFGRPLPMGRDALHNPVSTRWAPQ